MSTQTDQLIQQRMQQRAALLASKGATAKPKTASPNDWGDGKTHSISLATHNAHVATKRQAKVDSTLYDPAKILSGADLRNSVDTLADAQINPVVSSLDRQTADTQRQADAVTANAKAYYQQLQAAQQGLVGQAQAGETASNQQMSSIGTAAQQAQAALAKADQDRQAADIGVRGDIAGTTADQLAQSYADRASGIANRTGADQAAQAVKNAAGSQAAVGQALSAGQAGGEAITGLTNTFGKTLGDIAGKKSDALASRGGIVADLTQKLRQQGYDNLITQKGLDIKSADLEAETANNEAKITETNRHNTAMESNAERTARLGDKKYQLDKDKFGASKAKDMYQKTHKIGPYAPVKGAAGGSSVTAAQRDSRNQTSLDFWDTVKGGSTVLDQARAALPGVNATRAQNKQPPLGWNDATARAVLAAQHYKPYEIDAIIAARHNNGALPPDQVKALKARHITVKNTQRLATGPSPAPPDLNIAGTLGGLPG